MKERARTNVALALLCVVCFFALGSAVHFEDCGSTLGRFTEVSVTNCRASDAKCALVRGSNATISIKFIPNQNISNVTVLVYGVVLDIMVPFPLDKPNVCKDPDDGVDCPLQKDKEYHYTTTMMVQKKFPSVSVDIKWEFVNEKSEKIVCIQFPARVQLTKRFKNNYIEKKYNLRHNVELTKPVSVHMV